MLLLKNLNSIIFFTGFHISIFMLFPEQPVKQNVKKNGKLEMFRTQRFPKFKSVYTFDVVSLHRALIWSHHSSSFIKSKLEDSNCSTETTV